MLLGVTKCYVPATKLYKLIMSSHRKNHIPKVKSKVPPSIDTTAIGSDPSLRETAVSLLSGGPRRSEPAEPETFAIPPNRRYSKLATEEIKSKKGELNEKLKVAEQRSVPLCMRSRADVSDSHPNGPWARKAILSFDGGGVKGFSSLLIIKRLTSLIEEIETGQRRCNLVCISCPFQKQTLTATAR
ncbi:hypothetical protein EJ08DRAFT_605202 [Tothia fuscella]|uniref:PNPLA domain-containing protein n=1 Tax=Tothia fuscella TaxID=1048955 RepID=A0A9P4U2C5_9PEZI|nr:hypothetical protein EJ08DRAFT_605202 [Tothia fuscella]